MTAPKRIQRRRTKGWRIPEGAVYVGRPTTWGNPYRVVRDNFGWSLRGVPEHDGEWSGIGRELAIIYATSLFRSALLNGELPYTGDELVQALAGRDLACWCPVGQAKMPFWHDTQPCHADILVSVANGGGS